MIVVLLTQSSKAAKGEQEQGSCGDQQGHRAVVAFHPKDFRCACGKENGLTYSYHSGRHSFASLITLEAGVLISLKNIRQFWEIEPAWIPQQELITVCYHLMLKQHSR